MPAARCVDLAGLALAGIACLVTTAGGQTMSAPGAAGRAPSPGRVRFPAGPPFVQIAAMPDVPQPIPLETPRSAYEPVVPVAYNATLQIPPPPPQPGDVAALQNLPPAGSEQLPPA